MEIRKEFRYEMGHIVRNAWSRRCSRNAHGHSYRVEFLFEGPGADNGQMLVDFGFLKKYLHPFVDAFDHSFWLWDRPEDAHLVKFFRENFERVITSPFSTTAEMQAALFATYAQSVIHYLRINNLFENGETADYLRVSAVRVHETTTGYAEYRWDPSDRFPDTRLRDVVFSEEIWNEWPVEFQQFYTALVNPTVTPEFYLEVTGRQTGKTTRLVKNVVDWVKAGNDAVVYVANHALGELMVDQIVPLLQDSKATGAVHVCSFKNRKLYLLGKALNKPRYFYDEFDFFAWKDDDVIEDGAYMATTPKFVRKQFLPNDPIYKALCKSEGNFWGQVSSNTDYPYNERGALVKQHQTFIPNPDIPSLSKELAFYHVDVE